MRTCARALLGISLILALAVPALALGGGLAAPPSRARYLVLIVLDGFRPDYMNLAPMHHLHALMTSGATYSRAWVGQLESETPTGHATLVTGIYPRRHGVIGFDWRDGTDQIDWMPTDLRQLNSGDMGRRIEAGGAPSISDLLHRQYPGSKTVSMSGEKYYAADAMGTGADYILYGKAIGNRIAVTPIGNHAPPRTTRYWTAAVNGIPLPDVQDQFVARLAVLMQHTVHPQALLINLPGSDIAGHIGGVTDEAAMRTVVSGDDRAIGTIVAAYQRAGLYRQTLFVVTADHAMVPNSHIVPKRAMGDAFAASGSSVLKHDFLSSGGYVYLRNPADAARVANQIEARHFAHIDGVFYKSSAASGYAFQPAAGTTTLLGPDLTHAYLDLCDTFAAPFGPDIVSPYAEDTMGIQPHGYGPHWGNHGGLSWGAQHIPLVLSGPGVRHIASSYPAELVDVAPTIERLMGISIPANVDGVVLADGTAFPTNRDQVRQGTAGKERARDVTALIERARVQHGFIVTGRP